MPFFGDYQKYRPYLRADFLSHCAYCTGHENELGGSDHFDIDHWRPKSKFPSLINIYRNLYYSCRGCNKRGAKGEHWPNRALIKAGYRFFDPCSENAYVEHMYETKRGHLKIRTPVGEYSIKRLRLNREGLVILRRNRASMRRLLKRELKKLLAELTRIKSCSRVPSKATLIRLQQIRVHLKTNPVLCLLPEWWNSC